MNIEIVFDPSGNGSEIETATLENVKSITVNRKNDRVTFLFKDSDSFEKAARNMYQEIHELYIAAWIMEKTLVLKAGFEMKCYT